jgi:hypothetical protein
MAFIERLHFDVGSDVEIFNVSHAVGAGAANFWTDIMLVQYFLKWIYLFNLIDGSRLFIGLTPDLVADLPDPNKDFKSLRKTEKWIRLYQQDVLSSGGKVSLDGRVDRAKGFISSLGVGYSIHLMNQHYQFFVGNRGISNWQQWALSDPSMPEMLRGQLKTNLEV